MKRKSVKYPTLGLLTRPQTKATIQKRRIVCSLFWLYKLDLSEFTGEDKKHFAKVMRALEKAQLRRGRK